MQKQKVVFQFFYCKYTKQIKNYFSVTIKAEKGRGKEKKKKKVVRRKENRTKEENRKRKGLHYYKL